MFAVKISVLFIKRNVHKLCSFVLAALRTKAYDVCSRDNVTPQRMRSSLPVLNREARV